MAEVGVGRISSGLCYHYITALYMILAAADGLMDAAARAELINRIRALIAAEALPKRRARSCDRKVRQPVGKWGRMVEPSSHSSPTLREVSVIA